MHMEIKISEFQTVITQWQSKTPCRKMHTNAKRRLRTTSCHHQIPKKEWEWTPDLTWTIWTWIHWWWCHKTCTAWSQETVTVWCKIKCWIRISGPVSTWHNSHKNLTSKWSTWLPDYLLPLAWGNKCQVKWIQWSLNNKISTVDNQSSSISKQIRKEHLKCRTT